MAGSSTASRPVLRSLRQIIQEIRLNLPKDKLQVRNEPLMGYILQEFRRHQTTSKQHCKAGQEMEHLANAYATYLRSQREWHEVHKEYHASGERSVRETAEIVGFKLPHDPK